MRYSIITFLTAVFGVMDETPAPKTTIQKLHAAGFKIGLPSAQAVNKYMAEVDEEFRHLIATFTQYGAAADTGACVKHVLETYGLQGSKKLIIGGFKLHLMRLHCFQTPKTSR
jgi:hypothetical protein